MHGYIVVIEAYAEGKLLLSSPLELGVGKVNGEELRAMCNTLEEWARKDWKKLETEGGTMPDIVATVAGIYRVE